MKKTLLAILLVCACIFCVSCGTSPKDAISKANEAMDTLSGSKELNSMACYGEGEYDETNDRIYYYVYMMCPRGIDGIFAEAIMFDLFHEAKEVVRNELKPIFSQVDGYPDNVNLKMTAYTSDGYQYTTPSGWGD